MNYSLTKRVKNRVWTKIVDYSKNKKFYYKLYRSYWHFLFTKDVTISKLENYYTCKPNPGAGIGHQMANWIAGYWFSKQLGLQFAHSSFTSSKWDRFLGFGEGDKKVIDLLALGYKEIRLPLFDEGNLADLNNQKKIIASYTNQKIIFVAEQDQFYKDQFGIIDCIHEKFFNAPARENDTLIYDSNNFNIAIHVRRGDIVVGQVNQNENLLLRWQGNDYFEKVLSKVLKTVKTDKTVAIYLFSQGVETDFPEFNQFKNLHFCLDMNAQDSFLHMVFADVLITSKSSFSYKPALLNKGIKVCPEDFWHGYPEGSDWILVSKEGNLNAISI